MQDTRLFKMFIILGVLLAACQSFQPKEDRVEPVGSTQTPESRSTGIPTVSAAIPSLTSDGSSLQALKSVEPTSFPMVKLPEVVNPGFPLAIPRTRHTATMLRSGKILIVGGSVEGDDFAWDQELIDPGRGSSSWIAPLHTVRHDHSATLLDDGRVLVVGGYNFPQQWLGDAEIYNPITDTWTVIPPHSTHGTVHSATLMNDGRVLVVGGCIGSGVCTDKVEIFNPQTNAWADAAALQEDRYSQTAQRLNDGRVLIAGGVTAGGVTPMDGSALIYDPAKNTWEKAGSMNTPRFLAQSVKLNNGDVFVAGGFLPGSDPPEISNAVEIYHPDTNTWRTTASLIEARYAFILKLLPNGQVIAISGARDWDSIWNENSFVHEIEIFDPATEQWHVIGNLPVPSAFATGTQLINGQIWIAGGQVGNWVNDKNWLIQP